MYPLVKPSDRSVLGKLIDIIGHVKNIQHGNEFDRM